MARLLSQVRRRLADETGLGIVEVMVSAMLLIIVGVAVLDGIDTATGVSGQARARSVAANVAQEDQERMRTMKAQQLSNFFEVNTQQLSGITFTTTSRADWVSDSAQGNSCESGSASNDYLKLTTETKWTGTDRKVKLESIMAPPNGSFGPSQGSIGVQVDDRNDVGKPGVEVDIVGPPSYDKETDSQGCAFFGFLPSGNQYSAVLDSSGFVDPDGNQRVERAVSVQPEGLSAVSFKYDLAAQLESDFFTVVNGDARNARTTSMVLQNAGLTEGSRLYSFGNAGSHTVGSLFPFTVPYVSFAGACGAAAPPDDLRPDYSQILTPGESADLDVRMPALNVKVVDGGGAVDDADVKYTPVGPDCQATTKTTGSDGFVDRPEVPWGDYSVCVEQSGGHAAKTVSKATLENDPDGTDVHLLDLAQGQSGPCP